MKKIRLTYNIYLIRNIEDRNEMNSRCICRYKKIYNEEYTNEKYE